MDVHAVLADRQLKTKAKVETLGKMLLNEKLTLEDLIKAARGAKDSDKGTCIEAIEFATKSRPELASVACLKFVTQTLSDKASRVKWESARVIGNIAHLHPDKLDKAVCNLLTNTESPGTVVRWSAAFALGQIVQLRTKQNRDLIPAVEAILRREEDNAIKKIYQAALMDAAKHS
ncbi:MAG TPA: HEAT repeat domain-containing protein [Pyrinomonadaceae bacterium]|nr:HEAT repeat domain-containing protein [Pyrinomonadaceae bacterium]